jgi:hypothetical protein
VSRYVCVVDQKAAGFPVTTACEVVGVSTSGFYDWLKRQTAAQRPVRSPRPTWSA